MEKSLQKRRLGRTDLDIAPLVLGGNVFGWTADEKTSFDAARPLRRRRLQRHRHGRCLFALGAGQQGRRIRNDHRQMDEEPRQPRQGRRHHQGRLGHGAGQEGPLRRLYREGGRGVAEAAAGRCDRSLSVALAGPATPYEETLGAYREAARGKARSAMSAPPISMPASSRLRSMSRASRSCRATTCCSRNTISTTALASKGRCAICASRRRSASSPISPRQGVSLRQVPQQGRSRQKPTRRRRREISQCARHAHPRRARCRLGAAFGASRPKWRWPG